MADDILEVANICKTNPPHKVRNRLQNAGKNLTGPQLRQWTHEIYPQYAEQCSIAEALAPLVRSGRASPNIVNKTAQRVHSNWTRELIDRLESGQLTVNYGGKRTRKQKKRKTRKQRKHRKTYRKH